MSKMYSVRCLMYYSSHAWLRRVFYSSLLWGGVGAGFRSQEQYGQRCMGVLPLVSRLTVQPLSRSQLFTVPTRFCWWVGVVNG